MAVVVVPRSDLVCWGLGEELPSCRRSTLEAMEGAGVEREVLEMRTVSSRRHGEEPVTTRWNAEIKWAEINALDVVSAPPQLLEEIVDHCCELGQVLNEDAVWLKAQCLVRPHPPRQVCDAQKPQAGTKV